MGNFINDQESQKFSKKNNIPIKLDESIFILNDSDIKSFKIYSLRKLRPHQKTKINEYIENFHLNGTPRSSEDFSYKNFTKFYPAEDPFFYNEEIGLIRNHIKIYNENEQDINQIQIYEGDLNINGLRQGFGKLITQYYELKGIWKNDKLNGWGRQSRCNGDVLEGRFENGLLNGKGFFIDKQKNKYIGEFRDMKKWGLGKLITNKLIYEGKFINDKIEGKGKIKFLKSGIEYEGTFVNDHIEGYGKFKWINGDVYEGEVKNNKMHGNGIYYFKNGKIYKGLFENGQISHNENTNINYSLKSQRLNYQYDIEKFDYINPFRKIETIKKDNQEIISNNNKPTKYAIKTYQPISKNILNYENEKYEKTINENMFNINEFKQNKELNIHENNKYALNNVSKINKFIKDKNNFNNIKTNKNANIAKNKISKSSVLNNKNNNIKPQEKKENPELLLSTYRNYGFGDEFNNII